jgi:hypothetical protein
VEKIWSGLHLVSDDFSFATRVHRCYYYLMIPERRLRIYQIACLFCALSALQMIVRLPVRAGTQKSPAGEGLIVFLAIYSAWSGFYIQKIFKRVGKQGRRLTPLHAWQWGNITKLASALSVCLWAFVLHLFGGLIWLVYPIFGLGVVLLLIWKPGMSPPQLAQ